MTVLVVDDDYDFRRLAARLIAALGLASVESDSVAGALTAAGATGLSAALVDIDLPDGDGYTLAARLAPHCPRIVLTSANADAYDAAALHRSGALAFVAKSELPDVLTRDLLAGN